MPPGGKKHNVSSTEMAREGPVEDLPLRALSRPRDTARVAQRVLAANRSPYVRSYAGQALGIATRKWVMSPRPSATSARHWPRPPRAETSAGRRRGESRHHLGLRGRSKKAPPPGCGAQPGIGRHGGAGQLRRGVLLGILGRSSEEIAEHRRAARTLRAAGDSVWEARALNNLGLALIDRGDAPRAEDALTRAEALLADAGRTFDAANVRSNRGLVASLYGQVPEALAHYDAAERMYADAGVRSAELSEVRCSAFLAVGLYDDALRHGQEAVGLLRSQGASAAYRADALVRAAQAALAAGDPQIAREYATEAVRLFRRQERGRGDVSRGS
jgi:tetratricopeptide (TPR) repeat protein